MTGLERLLRDQWQANAEQFYFGSCDVCGKTSNHGRPLLVARQPRRRDRECIECFDARLSGRVVEGTASGMVA